MKNKTKQIYHHYTLWEDAKAGMYENPKDKEKESQIIINYFRTPELVKKTMLDVVTTWVYSMEQNLTNPSMNKIAYIGQASVTYLYGFSRDSTMYAWNFLDEKTQSVANTIAQDVLKYWEEENAEKIL